MKRRPAPVGVSERGRWGAESPDTRAGIRRAQPSPPPRGPAPGGSGCGRSTLPGCGSLTRRAMRAPDDRPAHGPAARIPMRRRRAPSAARASPRTGAREGALERQAEARRPAVVSDGASRAARARRARARPQQVAALRAWAPRASGWTRAASAPSPDPADPELAPPRHPVPDSVAPAAVPPAPVPELQNGLQPPVCWPARAVPLRAARRSSGRRLDPRRRGGVVPRPAP